MFLCLKKEKSNQIFDQTVAVFYPRYRPYFLIFLNNTIEDFFVLNHEIAHGIFLKRDDFLFKDKQNFYLSEIEGSFFDYLSWQYLKTTKKLDSITLFKLEANKIILQYNYLLNFYILNLVIHSLKTNADISINDIQNYLKKIGLSTYIDKNALLTILKVSPIELAQYLISYLSSIDLEKIFKKDPEYAFYILESIRNNKKDSILDNLQKNKITFMVDGYKNLQEKIKILRR